MNKTTPQDNKTAPKTARKRTSKAQVEQTSTLVGFTPRDTPLKQERSIGKSISNSISSSAEIIEELAVDGKKALKTIGKVCDYICVELDGLTAISYTENLNKLIMMGHSPESANSILVSMRDN